MMARVIPGPAPSQATAGLTAFLAERFDVAPETVELRLLEAGGHSNLTYMVDCDGERYVLRTPPSGPLPPTAHDVIREYRVLRLLDGTGVRVPRPVLACADPEVFGAPFYLMGFVEGAVLRDTLPAELDSARDRELIAAELVDALVELHAVDWRAAGIDAIAPDSGYLERQLRLWERQWEHNRTREIPELEAVGRWLTATPPTEGEVTVVHGDYKLDNVIVGTVGGAPRVRAILDWEMATLGDPMADLGYMTALWSDPGEDPAGLLNLSRITAAGGFPTRARLAELYAERSGRPVGDLHWYQVLALWKLAVLLEGSYRRRLSGTADDPWFDTLRCGIPMLAARAQSLIAQADGA